MDQNKYRFSIHDCQENIDHAGIDLLYIGKMNAPSNEEIRKFVKDARASMGLTQPQLAEKLSCTKANVSAWENGRHQPSYSQMLWMSEQSGVPLPHDKLGKLLIEIGIDIRDLMLTNTSLLKAAINVPSEDEAQAEQILTTFNSSKEKKSRKRSESK